MELKNLITTKKEPKDDKTVKIATVASLAKAVQRNQSMRYAHKRHHGNCRKKYNQLYKVFLMAIEATQF